MARKSTKQYARTKYDILLENQHRRQAILDHLHTVGPLTTKQIAAYLGMPDTRVSTTLGDMQYRREVVNVGMRGKATWAALTSTTVSAVDVQEKIVRAVVANNKAKMRDGHTPDKQPWRTVHIGGSLPKTSDQGGQGALRPTVYVNCCTHY